MSHLDYMGQVDFEKEQIYHACKLLIAEKITAAEEAIAHAEEASKDDTKSSAGDKYETTREMMQQEIARNQQQLQEAQKLKYQFELINPSSNVEVVQLGSLVTTSNGTFFIAVALGKIMVGEKKYFVISPVSPLGKLLAEKKAGATITFNQNSYHILSVY